jgi:hypothetical protein
MTYQPTGRPRGRPSTYSDDMARVLCDLIASGHSLREIASLDGMPTTSTILLWLSRHEDFSARYARAKEVQVEALAEEILTIADDGSNDTYVDEKGNTKTDQDVVQRSKLRVDSRKWLLSKLAPKKYGDRTDVNLSGSISIPEEQLDARIAELLRKAGTLPALAGPRTIEAEE